MLLVPCPNCGPRNHEDMIYVGETTSRPVPDSASVEWRSYLYLRDNPAGWLNETWFCQVGCRVYFRLQRHTVTNEFRTAPLPGSKTAGPAA